jgi:hypothetical protein
VACTCICGNGLWARAHAPPRLPGASRCLCLCGCGGKRRSQKSRRWRRPGSGSGPTATELSGPVPCDKGRLKTNQKNMGSQSIAFHVGERFFWPICCAPF